MEAPKAGKAGKAKPAPKSPVVATPPVVEPPAPPVDQRAQFCKDSGFENNWAGPALT